MAKIKIRLNEEHIKLINNFKVERINDIHIGFDTINPYGGSYLFEDLAMILGFWDKAIENSENDFIFGRRFGIDNEKIMIDVHNYLMDNFEFILSIIIQFSCSGGVKPGLYSSVDYNINWTFEEQKTETLS